MQDRAKGSLSLTFLCPLKWCSNLQVHYQLHCSDHSGTPKHLPDLAKASFRQDTLQGRMRVYPGETVKRLCLGVDVSDFLDRTSFARSSVSRCNDAAVGTLTEFLDELVLCIDNERRVERVEAMSW